MSFAYTPAEASFAKVWYVSTTGNDTTGDGSKTNPFASVKKAIESAASGDGIRIFPGTYRLLPMVVDPTYHAVGIFDKAKGLTIWGTGADTILEFYGSDVVGPRDAPLMYIYSTSTVVTDLTFNYYPNRASNYSNAIFVACRGTIQNCLIENKSSSVNMSASYYNSGPASSPKVYNCILKSNGRYLSDYSGSPLYVNCLYDFTPSSGTKQYCVKRTITANDYSLSSLPNDIKNTGDPNILNPDRSRSHIGVCGGTNAWGYSRMKCLIQEGSDIKRYTASSGFEIVGTAPPTEAMFLDYGMDEPEEIPNTSLNQLSDNFTILAYDYALGYAPPVQISFLPQSKVVFPKEDVELKYVEHLDSFQVTNVETGTGIVRIIVSVDQGETWNTWDLTSNTWISVDDLNDVKTKGMSASDLNARTSEDWVLLLNGSTTIRFAYYLEIVFLTDVAAIDKMVFQADMKSTWRKAAHGTQYDYEYPLQNILRISFYADGDYRINYYS